MSPTPTLSMHARPTLASVLTEEIRAEMARRGITRSMIAVESGKSLSVVCRVLNGSRRMTVDDALMLARSLGCPLSELVRRAEAIMDGV